MTGRPSRLALVRAGAAVVRHPSLWPTALRQLRRMRAPGHVGPSQPYLAFRMVTQYGAPDAAPLPDDVVGYLRWCRHWETLPR